MENQVPLFSQEELLGAAGKVKKEKASGLDGLPTEAIFDVVNVAPKWMLDLNNKLLAQQELPESCKRSKLFLVLKAAGAESKFRLICIIDTSYKLFEAFILGRLEAELEKTGGLATNQFGFRKDVSNAYNTARWELILGGLKQRGIMQYLIKISIEKNEMMEISMGVPQGSVLGPTLWNILYDGLLKLELPEGELQSDLLTIWHLW
nr:unnamed protein product [Callosobruchus chinensis]